MNTTDEEYLGRFPSESEYIRRIDDISKAINNGQSAYNQVQNLLYDLPYQWLEEIKPDIDKFNAELKNSNSQQISKSEQIKQENQYALKVKQRVISFLYDVGMWTAKRQKVPEGKMDLYHKNEDEED